MKVKLDENIPAEVGDLFARQGHDAHTVAHESLTGSDDPTVLAAAQREGRVLITQDLDFSDLRRYSPGTHPGIILFRLREPSRRRLTERMAQILKLQEIESWTGCFVVVGDSKLRIRRP